MKPLLAAILFYYISGFDLDAQLIRDRSVQCNSNEMMVTFEFIQPFNGVVYANRYYQSHGCRWEGNGSRRLQAPVPLTTNPSNQPYCGVQLKEANGEFTVTLLVSPMRGLLVEGMDTLVIRCLYTIGDVTLTLSAGTNGAGIQISPRTQGSVVTGSGGSPFLQMAIRDGHGINGEVIQVAQVGQRITLDIIMRDTTIYDFYVHDCYAHDGTNTPEASISIIDQNGCAVRLSRAVDVPVFTTPPVPSGGKHVYVHMYGFQFTTSQLVYFECQVRPCLQSCNRQQCLTSPSLPPPAANFTPRSRRSPSDLTSGSVKPAQAGGQSQDNYNLTTVIRVEPQELLALAPGAASSLNRDEYHQPLGENTSKRDRSSPNEVCVNTSMAIGLLSIFIIVCLVSLSVAGLICHKANTSSSDDNSEKGKAQFARSNETVIDDVRKRRLARHAASPAGDYYSSILSSVNSAGTLCPANQSPYASCN